LGRCSALQGHWEIATNVAKLPNCSIKVDLEMSLTRKQRAELKAIGPELVRQKILETKGVAPGTAVKGFKTASYLHRGDIEDWLIEKQGAGAIVQRYTLLAAIIAAAVGITLVAVATRWFTIWPNFPQRAASDAGLTAIRWSLRNVPPALA
jgi:hypothetical protein